LQIKGSESDGQASGKTERTLVKSWVCIRKYETFILKLFTLTFSLSEAIFNIPPLSRTQAFRDFDD
jgi:hypothetical protein